MDKLDKAYAKAVISEEIEQRASEIRDLLLAEGVVMSNQAYEDASYTLAGIAMATEQQWGYDTFSLDDLGDEDAPRLVTANNLFEITLTLRR